MSNLNCQYFSGWIFLSGPYSESEVISAWKTAGEPSFWLCPAHLSSESTALGQPSHELPYEGDSNNRKKH
jgi:hypothetical protein